MSKVNKLGAALLLCNGDQESFEAVGGYDMFKTDLTGYSDNELSLLVFNTEDLYAMRYRSSFLDILESEFIYTDEQLTMLLSDLDEETD